MDLQLDRLTVTDLAKHFWSVQAAEYIKDKEVSIKELDHYEEVISEAESWIDSALEKEALSPDTTKRREATIILAYPAARMFISILGNEYLLRRFADSVSKYTYIQLGAEDERKIIELASTPGNFGEKPWQLEYEKSVPAKDRAGERIIEWKLFFTDYISVAQSFHDAYWKLVNRPMKLGWVCLQKDNVTRLMAEALKMRISKGGLRPARDIPSISELPPHLRDAVERVSNKVKQRISSFPDYEIVGGGAGESAYPGCIKQILDKLSNGLGVSHGDRLALVFFLSNIGKDVDYILQVFSKAPDFDAQRTRYYIEHAMGLRGGGTKYKPYGCPKLKTYGICSPQDDWCKNGRSEFGFLKGPVDFYKAKSRLLSKRKEEKGSS